MYYDYQLNTMLANETSSTITTEQTNINYKTSFQTNRIKFWILLSLQLLSIPCFIYVFLQFFYKKQLRQNIHNHVILLLLIVSFLFVTIALSLTLAYMYTSHVRPATHTFCTLWNWLHYSLNIINLFLMAFACIERNWLIFHSKIVKSKGGRFLFHYCPLVFCVIYPPIFYASAMFIYKCVSYYNYTQLLCKRPCYFNNKKWSNVDLFFNNYTPLLSIPIFCTIIYVRVLIQKCILKQQRFKWRRDKKLVLQLWILSSLYIAMWMPLQLCGLINLYWSPTFLLQAQIDYMYLFPYLIHLVYPYIVLLNFHHEMLKCKQAVSVQPIVN
jgi:hypothetical protein